MSILLDVRLTKMLLELRMGKFDTIYVPYLISPDELAAKILEEGYAVRDTGRELVVTRGVG
jgi:hypothetical protein